MFDTKLKLRYLLSDLKLWHTKKSGLVRTQRTNNDQLILVDPVEEDVEEIRPRTDPPNVWQCAI